MVRQTSHFNIIITFFEDPLLVIDINYICQCVKSGYSEYFWMFFSPLVKLSINSLAQKDTTGKAYSCFKIVLENKDEVLSPKFNLFG